VRAAERVPVEQVRVLVLLLVGREPIVDFLLPTSRLARVHEEHLPVSDGAMSSSNCASLNAPLVPM
jgi:hypothetical protein